MAKRKAKKGDIVKVHYTGKLKDGSLFDTSLQKEPLHFIIGREEVIPGFEEAVIGMATGEKKTLTVPYSKAYGPRQKERIEEINLKDLPDDLDLKVGRQLEITMANGDIMRTMVTGLTDSTVTLDRNHPLAGKDLIFDIEVLEVQKIKTPLPPKPTA
jgi:peptidylprolyl isomerase